MTIDQTRGVRGVLALALAVTAGALAGCGKRGGDAAAETSAAAVTIGQENIAVVRNGVIQIGPAISGSLTAVREATVRAEVSGPVVQVYADKGQSVAPGQLIAKIDDTAIRDTYISAQSGVRSAEQAATLARRNSERTATLAQAGAVSERDLETARSSLAGAEAQLADARSRLALAQKQLENTNVRSPIRGIVSARPVNAGDVVSPGTALFTIVDPTGMRLEAAVPSDQLAMVRVGAPVQFTVNGYPGRTFTGRIERVSPAADPVTRQVPIYVSIPNTGGQLVSGLYAEGRVATESRTGLLVPVSALQIAGATASVLRVKNGRIERAQVQTGLRDEATESIQIVSGLAAGDTVLVGSAQGMSPGTPVRVQSVTDTRQPVQ